MRRPSEIIRATITFIRPDEQADRVVPPARRIGWLAGFAAGAMAFLCVFALAFALAAGGLATKWTEALGTGATIRISAPPEEAAEQADAVMALLQATPGIGATHRLDDAARHALLAPWVGDAPALGDLALPELIEIEENGPGFDADALRTELATAAPDALLDDHARWRRPLVAIAARLRLLGLIAITLIGAAMVAMITLAAGASLAVNAREIAVLRLIGARDAFIARAFVRRFTLRALIGATAGTAAGVIGLAILARADRGAGFLAGLGPHGAEWLWPVALPFIAAALALIATRRATIRRLNELK